MSLPEPHLDDLRFQRDLVDEARRRIIQYCPEWTDYNVSDPGITLIELFAWMTELTVYRLNQVPEKNYIRFLELLGIRLQPASSAWTELTFYLSAPFPIAPEDDTVAFVPAGTEVATRRNEQDEEVIFTTDDRLLIAPPLLEQLRREDDVNRNYLPRLGVEPFYAFRRTRPQEGDTFYLGFDPAQPLSGAILNLWFSCERTQATGIKREDPPLVWECSLGDGRWQELPPSTRPGEKDTTGGLNNEEGSLTLYLPLTAQADRVHGREAYWVRCRYEQRRKEQGRYSESPRIQGITAYTLGAATLATHAVIIENEFLGNSSGEPGQRFFLEHAPVLDLLAGETVQIEEKQYGEMVFVPWERVEDFSRSDRHDRHFTLDTATGELSFGPGIRQPDGSVQQYGRVPETGRRIRFARYRHGGGVTGNVPANRIQVLKSSVPYIDHVTNLQRSSGGRDPETLDEAKMRARRELRAQQRAVTAEDYENLCRQASRAVARVRCNTPCAGNSLPPGTVELLVVPDVREAILAGDLAPLAIDPRLHGMIHSHLDQYRLITTSLQVRSPRYLGVRVEAEIVPAPLSAPDEVRRRAREALYQLLTPLPMEGSEEQNGQNGGEAPYEGWPFGHDLYVTELYALLQGIPGVKHVRDVRVSTRPVIPAEEVLRQLQGAPGEPATPEEALPLPASIADEALTPVSGRFVAVAEDTLLCSLAHEIHMVEP